MRVDDAKARFSEMLAEAGIDFEKANPRAVWDVFTAFAAEPVDVAATDPDRDMVIAEWQTCEWEGFTGLHLGWWLRRQFVVHDERGEYDHMEHLMCLVLTPVSKTPDVDMARGGIGFWPTSMLGEFAKDVEATQPFEVIRQAPTARVWVDQEHI